MNEDSFNYRTTEKIIAFNFNFKDVIISVRNKVIKYCRITKKIKVEIQTKKDILKILYWNNIWVFFSKDCFFFLSNDKMNIVSKTEPLSFSIVSNDNLLNINNKEICIFKFKEKDVLIHRIKLKNENGICCNGINYNKNLFLAFENGKIFKISNKNIESLVDVDEIEIEKFELIAFLKEPITSLSILKSKLVVSLFNKKIVIVNKSKDIIYTDTPYVIKNLISWEKFIITIDENNNLIVFNEYLQLLKFEKFNEKIINLANNETTIMIGFEGGIIKEYTGNAINSLLNINNCRN